MSSIQDYSIPTRDRESIELLTKAQVGITQSLTPEGYLLCESVPLARIGWMQYHKNDGIPLEPGPDGFIRVYRGPDELFHDHVIMSATVKPVTNEHPDDDVTPDNWQKLSVGIMFNIRQGEGEYDDCLVGDLLITEKNAIADVKAMKREVSLGYDAQYRQTKVGEGTQTDILVNHIALVDRGRCGPRCAIGDHDSTAKEIEMPAPVKQPTAKTPQRRVLSKEAIRAIFRDTAESIVSDLEDGDGSTTGEEVGGTANMAGGSNGSAAPVIHVHLGGQAGMPTPTTNDGNDPMNNAAPAPNGAPPQQQAPAGDVESRIGALETGMTQIQQQLATIAQAVQAKAAPAPAAPPAGKAEDEMPDELEDGEQTNDSGEEMSVGTSGNASTGPGSQPNPGNAMGAGTQDSAALETSWKELIATAEILVPGLRFPTFDASAKRAATIDSMCGLRRRVLDHLNMTADGAALVRNSANGGNTDTLRMSCQEVGSLFKAAGAAKRVLNNAGMTRDASAGAPAPRPIVPNSGGKTAPRNVADLNAMFAQHYKITQ